MKIKTTIIASFLAGLWLMPAISQADPSTPPFGQAYVDLCKEVANNPNVAKNCQGKCVSFVHVCADERTGLFINPMSAVCLKKYEAVTLACLVGG